jgi:hypothetical protein
MSVAKELIGRTSLRQQPSAPISSSDVQVLGGQSEQTA